MNVSLEVPPELADAELAALVLPFGEEVNALHEDAPRRYQWGDVALPRRPVPLREEHDGREIGLLSSFVLDRTGIWARLKPGRTAAALIAKGFTGISAEIDDGRLTGAALVTDGRPAFASARVYSQAGAVLDSPAAPLRLGLGTGLIAFPTDMSMHRRELEAHSIRAVHADVELRRREFERQQEELAQQDVLDEQMQLIATGTPVVMWPDHLPMRRSYDEMVARQRAEEGAEYEAERERQHLEFLMAAAAVPPPRRRWWQRIRRWWR